MVAITKNKGKGKAPVLSDDGSDEEFATQGFMPHESDAEQLWDVVKIHGERNGMYLVEWDGADENGKPWPNSWVPREDVTDDLVEAWKKKKAVVKKEKARKAVERREKKRQGSSAGTSRSRIDSKGSTVTRSSATATARRSTRFSSVTTVGRAETASVSTIRSSPSRKRKQSVLTNADGSSSDDEYDIQRKRRRTVDSSPPKKSTGRPPDSEAEEVEFDAHRYSRTGLFPVRKEGKISKGVQPPPGRQANEHKSTKRTGKPSAPEEEEEAAAATALALEEEEEEEEEDSTVEERFKVMDDTPEKPMPYVFISPKTVASPENGSSVTVLPKNGSPGRIRDRRPTPPRRTLAKSHPRRPASSAAPTRSKVLKRTKRGCPPGVRFVGDQPRIESPSSSSSQVPNIHPESDAPLAEKGSRQERSHSPSRSDEASQRVMTSPSKLRQGFMKGKSKPVSSVSSPKDASAPPSLTSPVEFEYDLAEADDIGLAYDHNTFDDPLLFSQDVEPLLPDAGTPIPQADAEPEKNDTAPVDRSSKIVPNVGPTVQEGQHDAIGLPKGTVIPASQSQSQSQSQPGSRDDAQDEVQLASVLAVHGSPVQRMEVDTEASTAPALLDSSHEVEIQPDSTDTVLTDPESSANTNAKAYKKIPVVTPSKFRPYLPQQKPLSTLIPPHIQGMHVLAPNAEPSSFLESPVRDFDTEDRATPRRESRSNSEPGTNGGRNELDEDDDIEGIMPHSFELQKRGLELAEIQRQRMRGEILEPASRIQLDALLEERARKTSSRSESRGSDMYTTSGSDLGTPYNAVKPLGEADQPTEDEDDETRVRRFEEEYLDFDGNAGADTLPSVPDNASGGTLDKQLEDEEPLGPEDDASEAADVEFPLQDADEDDDPFRVRDAGNDRSATPTTTASQQDDMELSYTPRFKILGSPSKLETSATETQSRQLDEAMGLLHVKSKEIERLKLQLAESEQKRLSRDEELASLRAENAVVKKTQESQPDTSVDVNDGLLEQCKKDCESLTRDRDALDAEIKLLKLSRDDAVKQADIFRDLYGKVSSFADEMKQENAELLARAKLAEGQVKVGLELIRKQNVAQQQKLRAELERQQIFVNILKTRDTRTDDELRRRAAMEPELQGKIVDLQEEIHDLRNSQSNVLRERNDLLVEKQELNDKLCGLRSNYNIMADDMCWLQIRVARLTAREKAFKKVFLTTSEFVHDNELDRTEERVYICKWMMDYDSKNRCNSLFTSVQDLKDHLFVDHQL